MLTYYKLDAEESIVINTFIIVNLNSKMTEAPQFLDFDNDTLSREYQFYRAISSKSTDVEARQAYVNQLNQMYEGADKNHDHKI